MNVLAKGFILTFVLSLVDAGKFVKQQKCNMNFVRRKVILHKENNCLFQMKSVEFICLYIHVTVVEDTNLASVCILETAAALQQ